MSKTLVIGGGPAGCIAAQMLIAKGHDVTLVERGPVLGGSCRTYYYGGHPYTIGPRHFLTKREDVWEYMNRWCPMHRYDKGHEFLTYIERDRSFCHFPIHVDDIDVMPDGAAIREELSHVLDHPNGASTAQNLEEYWIRSVGPTLYDKVVNGYSKKMWGGAPDTNRKITDFGFTPKGVALKSGPSKAAWDEAISGFPLAPNGYDDWFEDAVDGATVLLDTVIGDFDVEKKAVWFNGALHRFDLIISTISPEIVMKNAFGPLRWMGRDFMKLVLPVKEALPPEIFFLYYANDEPFTRIVEYKKFYQHDRESPTTLLGIEIPSTRNKLYPFPMKEDQDKHQKYIDACPKDVHFIGRNGSYRYLDIGMTIEQCMTLFKDL